MKVLQVLPSLSLKLGGPTQVALNLVRNLIQQGVETEIVTTDDDNGPTISQSTQNLPEYKPVPIHFLKSSSLKFNQFIPSLELTKWLWRNSAAYDLVDIHYFFTFSSSIASMIARKKGVPYSVRPMGQLTKWCLEHKSLRKSLYWKCFDNTMLKNAALVQCTSKEEIEDIRRVAGDTSKCMLLPLGAEPPQPIESARDKMRARLQIPKNDVTMLFMSRLHEKKRPDLLIKTIRNLNIQGKSTQLIIAGEGDPNYTSELKALVTQYNLNAQVHFLGFVSGEEKSLLLRGSDIFVLPSYSENFGVAVVEALHAGVPVIVSKGIHIADEISRGEAGLIVESEEESLIQGVLKLVNSPELRASLGRNALKLAAERYSWPEIAKQVKHAYENAIENHKN